MKKLKVNERNEVIDSFEQLVDLIVKQLNYSLSNSMRDSCAIVNNPAIEISSS